MHDSAEASQLGKDVSAIEGPGVRIRRRFVYVVVPSTKIDIPFRDVVLFVLPARFRRDGPDPPSPLTDIAHSTSRHSIDITIKHENPAIFQCP